MARELAEIIRGLSPGALQLYKKQLAALPERDRQQAFSKLAGIPELADLVGGAPEPRTLTTEQPEAEQPGLGEIWSSTKVPLWQKGLATFAAPFEWVGEHITEPFGAIVTSPFTKGVEGSEGMSWLERERAEYEQGVPGWLKFGIETIPWLAIPGIGAVGGRAGMAAGRGIAGWLGGMGRAGRVAGTALEYSPWGLAEKATGKIVSTAAKPVVKALGKAAGKYATPIATKGEEGLSRTGLKLAREIEEGEGEAASYLAKGFWERGIETIDTHRTAKTLTMRFIGIKNKDNVYDLPWIHLRNPKIKVVDQPHLQLGTSKLSLPYEAKISIEGLTESQIKEQIDILLSKIKPERKALYQKTISDIAIQTEKEALAQGTKQAEQRLSSGARETTLLGHRVRVITKESDPDIYKELIRTSGKQGGVYIPETKEIIVLDRLTDTALHEIGHKLDFIKTLPKDLWGTFQKEFKKLKYTPQFERLYGQQDYQEVWADVFAKVVKGKTVKSFPNTSARLTEFMGAPPIKPPKKPPTTVTAAMPEGFKPEQQGAIDRLISLFKGYRGLARETRALRKPVHAARSGEYEATFQELRSKGMEDLEAHFAALKKLEGKYPEATVGEEAQKLINDLQKDQQTLASVVGDANIEYGKGFGRVVAFEAFQKMMLLKPLANHEISVLEDVFGKELAEELLKQRSLGQRLWSNVVSIANMPRALLASCDASYLLRQGAIGLAGYPKTTLRTFRPSLRALFSDDAAFVVDDMIRARPKTQLLMDHGLEITAVPSRKATTKLIEREEPFMTDIFDKIADKYPKLGNVNFVKMSNRGYVTGLNNMRSNIGEQILGWAEQAGWKVTEQDYREVAGFINAITGRGSLGAGAFRRAGGLLNAIFFAPKLIVSRFQVFKYLWSPSALARREAWKTLSRFFGTGSAILTAAKLSGAADVETDPRSSDFGKLKIGDTRLDIWTGYTQYARFIAELVTAQKKATESGRIYKVNRKDIVDRMVQTKLSPASGIINDLLKGESYMGEALPPKTADSVAGQFYQRMMPLAIQDMVDATHQDGFLGGIPGSLGFFGVGVVTYTDDLKDARDDAAQRQYGMTWDEVGLRLGQAAQLRLEQTDPEIVAAEKEHEKRFAAGTPTLMEQWLSEGKGVEDAYREEIDLAVKEFRATGDGVTFRERVNAASDYRRTAYASRASRKEYEDIVNYYQQPIDPEKAKEMNPGDVLRREYYQTVFAPDMYDEFGNYRFDEAEIREQAFLVKHGQQALDYIEEYRGSRWIDKPSEMKLLEQAREILRPYWAIADQVWSQYPPALKDLSERIQLLERTDPKQARRILRKYPQILRAREMIAKYRKMMRQRNPQVQWAYSQFYSY